MTVLGVLCAPAIRAESLTITLTKVSPGDVKIVWTGGKPLFEVLRGIDRDGADLTPIAALSSGDTYLDVGAVHDGFELELYRVTSAPVAASYADIQCAIFTPSCAQSGCHSGALPRAGLDLSEGVSHGQLVGIVSAEQPPLLRGGPAQSGG